MDIFSIRHFGSKFGSRRSLTYHWFFVCIWTFLLCLASIMRFSYTHSIQFLSDALENRPVCCRSFHIQVMSYVIIYGATPVVSTVCKPCNCFKSWNNLFWINLNSPVGFDINVCHKVFRTLQVGFDHICWENIDPQIAASPTITLVKFIYCISFSYTGDIFNLSLYPRKTSLAFYTPSSVSSSLTSSINLSPRLVQVLGTYDLGTIFYFLFQ